MFKLFLNSTFAHRKLIEAFVNTLNTQQTSIFSEFKAMTKAGLAFSVVFSTLAGYLLAVESFESIDFKVLLMLAIGGYCMVGASNAFNQIIEKG